MSGTDNKEFESFVDSLLREFDLMDSEEKKEHATNMLIKIGALNEDGSEKEQIVTGDFFGW